MGQTFVCEACIEESGLRAVVQANLSSSRCDYCNREEEDPIACELSIVTDFMRERIEEEYTDPVEELPYESAEGGYQGDVIEGSEILAEIDFCIDNTQLFDDISDAFSDSFYCRRDYFGLTPSEYRKAAWGHFKRVIKHQRRYTFWNSLEEPDFMGDIPSAGQTLSLIAGAIHEVGPLLVVPKGTEFWRVRLHDEGKAPTDPAQFTPPPVEFANQPNRMSPAGIPMFYGSDDFETSVVETVDPGQSSGKASTGVKFTNLVSLNLLDLTNIPPSPSYFVEGGFRLREVCYFLRSFAADLSRPIRRDGRQHIEYVPTQVFTEYVRYELKTPDDEPYHGIKYKSSRNGRPCYVIFAEQADCISDSDGKTQIFQCVEGSLTTTQRLVLGVRIVLPGGETSDVWEVR